MKRDIFVCHTGVDKKGVVRPLVAALEESGVSCWLDENEIKWGDSITEKVNEGLRISRFVIVVLSLEFLDKSWPQSELNAVLNVEAATGEVKVLPLFVGDKVARENILEKLPLLNDKLFQTWTGTPAPVVKAALVRLSKVQATVGGSKPEGEAGADIPLPKVRKGFSQRDKDLFLKESFEILKDYFRKALSRLEAHELDVETDFIEVHNYKFMCKIYLDGEIKSQGKVWVGGLAASDAIAYSDGQFNIDRDNSYNELITVEDDGFNLYLRFSIGVMYQRQEINRLSPNRAAAELWKRFSSPLEY